MKKITLLIINSSLISLFVSIVFCLKVSKLYKFYGRISTIENSSSASLAFFFLTLVIFIFKKRRSLDSQSLVKNNIILTSILSILYITLLLLPKNIFSYAEPFQFGTVHFYIFLGYLSLISLLLLYYKLFVKLEESTSSEFTEKKRF